MPTIEKLVGAPFDNGPIDSNGQYRDYAVLPQSERDKGFVRPVRRSYKHVGKNPKYLLRNLTEEETARYSKFGYIKFEKYPDDETVVGRYWTQKDLDKRCGTITTMGIAIAETYARNPKYYGSTFCCQCKQHLPVEEFIWEGTTEIVGS